MMIDERIHLSEAESNAILDALQNGATIYRNGSAICGRGGTATYLISGRERGIDTIRFELSRHGDSAVEARQYILEFR